MEGERHGVGVGEGERGRGRRGGGERGGGGGRRRGRGRGATGHTGLLSLVTRFLQGIPREMSTCLF